MLQPDNAALNDLGKNAFENFFVKLENAGVKHFRLSPDFSCSVPFHRQANDSSKICFVVYKCFPIIHSKFCIVVKA